MCVDLFYSFSKIYRGLLPDKRQRSKSSQFRKLALSVSVDDSKFYLTTNYSRPITLTLLGQKTYPFFEEPCSLNLLFQTVDYKLNSKFPIAKHAYRDCFSVYFLCILDFTHSEQKCQNKETPSVT